MTDFEDVQCGAGWSSPVCKDCKFYIWADSGYGYCRRYPPEMVNLGKWWKPKWEITYQLVEWCRRSCGEFIPNYKEVKSIDKEMVYENFEGTSR